MGTGVLTSRSRKIFPKILRFLLALYLLAAAFHVDADAQDNLVDEAWREFSSLLIDSIEYTCDSDFSEDRVRSATVIQVGDTYSRSGIRKSIEQIYSLRKFSQIEVDAERANGGVKLTFILTKQVKLGSVSLLGNEEIRDSEIIKVIKLKPAYKGQEYDESIADADVEAIKKLYTSRGFFDAVVFSTARISDQKEAEVVFRIKEGKQPIIRNIILLGTNEAIVRTSEIIKSMKRIKAGQPYTGQQSMALDVKNIEKLYRERGFITARVKFAKALSEPDAINKYEGKGKSFPAENLKENDLENGSVVVVIDIQSGKKVDVDIRVVKPDGEIEIDETPEQTVALYRMNSISEPVLRKSAEEIEKLYRDKGYYRAKIDYELLEDKNWKFTSTDDAKEWIPVRGSSAERLPNGALEIAAEDGKPQIQNQNLSIYSDKYEKIVIRMKIDEGNTGRLNWINGQGKSDHLDFDLITDGQFHNYEIDIKIYSLTGDSIENLEREGVPADIIEELESIKDRKFTGSERLMREVIERIGSSELNRFRAMILKYSKKRSHENWSGKIREMGFEFSGTNGADVHILWIRAEMTAESIPVIFTVFRGKKFRIKTSISITNSRGEKPVLGIEKIKKQMLTRKKHPLAFWPFKSILPDGIYNETVLADDLRSIIAFYRDNGYSQAKIEQKDVDVDPDKGEINIAIEIYEGPRTALTEVIVLSERENVLDYRSILSGLPSLRDQIVTIEEESLRRVRYKINSLQVFREDYTVADRSYLRSRYADKGYFAQIQSNREFSEDNTEVKVTYNVTMGERIRLDDEIEIIGNVRTRRYVIEREISDQLMEERVFNSAEVRKSWQRLLDMGIFSGVKISTEPLGATDGLHKMIVDVTERDAISVNMHVGSDSTAAFRAGLEASHINLWGTDRRARGRAQVGTEGTSLKFDYSEPRFLGTRAQGLAEAYKYSDIVDYNDVNGNRKQYTETWTGGSGGIIQRFGRINTLNYGYRYEIVDYVDILDETERTAGIGSLEMTFQRDTRTNPMNPRRGWLNSIALEYANKILGGDETFAKVTLSSMHFSPLSQDSVMAIGARLGYTWGLGGTERVLTPKKFDLSDYTTPRGFKWTAEDAGDLMINTSLEIRFPIYKKVDGALFFDSGYVFDRLSEFDSIGRINSAVGLGFRFITPIGPIRVDYGYPVSGDGQRNVWPHIAFGHAF